VTEAEARALLRVCDGIGGLEAWIAEQSWQPGLDGWIVPADLDGWRFRLQVLPGGIRISASAAGAEPAVWIVLTN
jgi:hypothetical protein